MKTFKRTLSLVLAVCMLASIAMIVASAVSKTAPREDTITYFQRDDDGNIVYDGDNPVTLEAKQKYGTRPVVSEVVNSDKDETTGEPINQVKTRTYRFYMPDAWDNDRNDNYDGTSLDSCSAGIYWWSTSYNSDDYKNFGVTEGFENAQGWPGFRILEQDPDDPNIFVCEVPEDAGTIIFDNTVDGGQTPVDNPGYGYNFQTVDIKTTYVDADDDSYGFYKDPEGVNPGDEGSMFPMTMEDKIFIVNPKDTKINEFSGATTTNGEWFYYYGEGKYGVQKTLAEAEEAGAVLSNGDFPSALKISDVSIFNYLNDDPTFTVYCTAEADKLTAVSEDESIATTSAATPVEGDAMWKSKVTITGKVEGVTKVKFTETDGDKVSNRTLSVENTYMPPRITTGNKTVYVGKTVKIATVKMQTSVSYKSSNTKVATVSASGVVTGKKAGTATITITAKAGSRTVTKTAKVTVKKNANTLTVKGSTKKLSYKTLKKKAVTVKAVTISKAKGTVTYSKKSGNAKITVNKKTGKLTVKKGLKKGTYTVKVNVKAAGNTSYNAVTKVATVKIIVK